MSDDYQYSGKTEWEDILIKHNVIPEPERIYTDDEIQLSYKSNNISELKKELELSEKSLDQLDELEDDLDENILELYRNKRMAEMLQQSSKEKYGRLFHIGQTDYTNEVTNESNNCLVVVHLFQNSLPACKLINSLLEQLAPQHKAIKFVKIIASEAIKNWPERQCPALLVYNKTNIFRQFIGIETMGGLNTNKNILEWILAEADVLKTKQEEDPRNKLQRMKITRDSKNRKHRDDDDYSD